jgi:hypothetical protein
MLADFGKASFSLLLTDLSNDCSNAVYWKKADYIMTVAMRNLRVE